MAGGCTCRSEIVIDRTTEQVTGVTLGPRLLSFCWSSPRARCYSPPQSATERLPSTALHKAADGGHLPVVELLLNRGADPDIRDEGDNATALHFAAERGDLPVVKLLIERGADVNGFGDLHGWDVIGWATLHEEVHNDVAEYLRICIRTARSTTSLPPLPWEKLTRSEGWEQ